MPSTLPNKGASTGSPLLSGKVQLKKRVHQEDSLTRILCVCLAPVLLLIIDAFVPLPGALLSAFITLCCVIAIARSFNTPEYLFLAGLLYFLFANFYSVKVGPGLNGTNIMLLLAIALSFYYAGVEKRQWLPSTFGKGLMICWLCYILLSGVIAVSNFGSDLLLKQEFNNFKALLDQFIWYYTVLSLMQTPKRVQRAWLYIAVAAIVAGLFGLNEAIERSGAALFDDRRVGGPVRQANEFGAYLAYTAMPLLSWCLLRLPTTRALMPGSGLVLVLQALVATFSRASYLGFVLAAGVVSWQRGVKFFFGSIFMCLALLVAFPQLIPQSALERIGMTSSGAEGVSVEEKLDTSAAHRLVMWEAALQMTVESPLVGKGYKGIPMLKAAYTREPVPVSDPHNMYLNIAAEMGLPALGVFIAIFVMLFWLAAGLSRHTDPAWRAIGIGLCGAVVCLAVVNMFGTRMVNLSFTAPFWVMLAVAQLGYQYAGLENPPKRQPQFAKPAAPQAKRHSPALGQRLGRPKAKLGQAVNARQGTVSHSSHPSAHSGVAPNAMGDPSASEQAAEQGRAPPTSDKVRSLFSNKKL